MTIFLFANVLCSGLALFGNVDLKSRRLRFISAMSLAVGGGVTVWPWAFLDMRASYYTAAFWSCADCSAGMKGLRNAVSIFLSTGYCVGSVVAIILNLILPDDPPEQELKSDVNWASIGAKEIPTKESDVNQTMKEDITEGNVADDDSKGDAAPAEAALDDVTPVGDSD